MLEIHNLRKSYHNFHALNGLHMKIQKGELFGFVGPNGAGKTTTMRIITGLLEADSGTVVVDGINIKENLNAVKYKIGYMPDFFGVYHNLKVIEYMEFYASMYGIVGRDARKLGYQLIDLVNLTDKVNSYVDELSRGMKQRLCLARCLVHNPQLLLMDEPTSGLDPRARVEMKKILKQLQEQGKTILISSHILPELAETCTHIGIIERGRMVKSGAISEIMSATKELNPISIQCIEGQEAALKVLKDNDKVLNISLKDNSIYVKFTGDKEEEAGLLIQLIASGAKVISFNRAEGSLENLFMQIIKENE